MFGEWLRCRTGIEMERNAAGRLAWRFVPGWSAAALRGDMNAAARRGPAVGRCRVDLRPGGVVS